MNRLILSKLKLRVKLFYLIFSYAHNFGFVIATYFFLRTNAVGAKIPKMIDRVSDFKYIIRLLQPNPSVLEFGSGFSTLLFSQKTKNLLVFEEFFEFLPKFISNNGEGMIKEVEDSFYGGFKTRRFKDKSNIEGKHFDLIYIDGPQTPIVESYAAPNIDLFDMNKSYLRSTVIAIDVRFQTVIETQKYLADSHSMFISRRFANRLNNFENLEKSFMREFELNGSLLKLTSLFLPKNMRFEKFAI